MLNIIEPKNHRAYQARIDSFLSLLKIYQNFSLPQEDLKKATFIIASDAERGVRRGALLCKKKVGALDQRIAHLISVLHSKTRKVWTVSLFLEEGEPATSSCIDKLELSGSVSQRVISENPASQRLTYQSLESQSLDPKGLESQTLLKKLIKFGKKQKASFLILSLRPTPFLKIQTYSHWPYLLEVQPEDSADGLFHGIVDLKSQKPQVYAKSAVQKPEVSKPKASPWHAFGNGRETL